METYSRKGYLICIEIPEGHPYKDGRTCTTCHEFKLAEQYTLSRDKRSFGGVAMRSKCKSCDEFRKYKRFIQKTYGVSYTEYGELLESQDYKCVLCKSDTANNKRTERLFVDHCHTTGQVRGLLCSKCNHALGLFNDDPNLLLEGIKYLNRARSNETC